MLLIITTLMALTLSWYATTRIIRYAPNIGLVHAPNQRSSHTRLTPHGGGIAIVLVSLLLGMILITSHSNEHYKFFYVMLALFTLIAGLGLWDDLHAISSWLRLSTHFLACLVLWFNLFQLPTPAYPITDLLPFAPELLNYNLHGSDAILALITQPAILLTAFCMMFIGAWWINLFNFMDGIDGLAASQALFMLLAASFMTAYFDPDAALTTTWAWMLCISAAIAGFLILNWAPARIFMGDTGSTFLAFALLFFAAMSISLNWLHYSTWLILGAVFITDSTVTLLYRMLSGQAFMEAHRSHAYQRLSRHWKSHVKVTTLAIKINLFWLLPAAWLSLLYPDAGLYLVLGAYLPLIVGAVLLGAGHQSAELLVYPQVLNTWQQVYSRQTNWLTQLDRPVKQRLMMVADIFSLSLASVAAYHFSYDGLETPPDSFLQQGLILLAPALIGIPLFIRIGLYRSILRYASESALWVIVKGVTTTSVIWTALAFLMQRYVPKQVMLPRATPLLFLLLALLLVGATRFLARWVIWSPLHKRYAGRQVLIYGVSPSARELSMALGAGKTLFPAGYIDDNPDLHGKDVNGLRVYARDQLPELIQNFQINDIILTTENTSIQQRRNLVRDLEYLKLRVQILPTLSDLATGKHLVNWVREIDIDDLLGRDPIAAQPPLLSQCITNKRVLVTGAAGSIGSELCRQILSLQPHSLTILEQSEPALYQLERKLQPYSQGILQPILGSVKDRALLKRLISEQQIQTIYHAAAHKHVPLVEDNIAEGIDNNTLGTWNVAEAAFGAGVETLVLISTDKAVRPTNVMGATKRWAELVVQYFAEQARIQQTGQHFCAVRFGNVLGSSGSVIPLFKEQIAHGGPITVTHPEITRYFMSIHEAVELVIQAGSLAQGGDIFLLDMGEAVNITQLAEDMIKLAGHTRKDNANPDGDIEIVYSGLRPGEKLYEEWLIDDANAENTCHPKILRGNEPFMGSASFLALMNELRQQLAQEQVIGAKALLMDVALQK